MPSSRRKFGDWGEGLAQKFLQDDGFEIIDNNFQKRCGEIDIIAKKENILHFIEVKTRRESSIEKFGLPEEAITEKKREKIIKTAETYLMENNYPSDINWQIDVVSIIKTACNDSTKINYMPDAFDAN